MLTDTIDFYHFIPLSVSVTLILAGGSKVSTKENLLVSFPHTFSTDEDEIWVTFLSGMLLPFETWVTSKSFNAYVSQIFLHKISSSSSSVFPAVSLGLMFASVIVFWSNHRVSRISSSWMVHAGCVFVASIHLCRRTWMSGSFESLRWNACVHILDLGLYSHWKRF